MKQVPIIGVIFTVGVLVLLKVFQDEIPRIDEPITNTLVFLGFVIFGVLYGISKMKKIISRSKDWR
ncbi:hypothetical protein [Paucisalibacillus sp. EB02]|uniref:hypothetical protein n=1 Tax=Paucisalibacillus sp. EB02 TaxID=1347087 RepID=UPI0004B3BE1F|nr:hypothetical protein [Paucisalibacillus sp. EB02]